MDYKKTLKEHIDAKEVGWRDDAKQREAFVALRDLMPMLDDPNKRILDVGCGTGAFYRFLCESYGARYIDYHGIDIMPEMIDRAIGRHASMRAEFSVNTVFDIEEEYDIVVCCGVFNLFPAYDKHSREKYVYEMLSTYARMFQLSKQAAIWNQITLHKNDFLDPNVNYVKPYEMLEWALSHCGQLVKLDHSYNPWNFAIAAYKEPQL